ncbi:MAG TPA: hypothetical protein VGB07_03400 [Blastocatellia bacterium]
MEQAISLEEVLNLAKQLSPVDKVRLFEKLAPEIERDLQLTYATPRKSLRGLWKGLSVTDEDISEVRQEMWANFPRSDI